MTAKIALAGLAALTALQALLLFDIAARKANTVDENVYIAAGVDQIRNGNPALNGEHPPFAKTLIGGAIVLWDDQAGVLGKYVVEDSTLWNKDPAGIQATLLVARLPIVLLTLLTTWFVAWGAWLLGGPRGGLIGGALFALSPNTLAHGSLATLDMPVTSFLAAAFVLGGYGWFYRRGPVVWAMAALAGGALGLALGSKLTALFGVPVLVLTVLVDAVRTRRWARGLGFVALAALAALFVLWAVHGFPLEQMPADQTRHRLQRLLGRGGAALLAHIDPLPFPFGSYVDGLNWQLQHSKRGHNNYLWGEVGNFGWWYFYFVALAVKIPLGTQLLGLAATVEGTWAKRGGWRTRARFWIPLAFPLVFFLYLSFGSTVQNGIKYLLPAFPLVFVAIGGALGPVWTRATEGWRRHWTMSRKVRALWVPALVLVAALASLRVQPHQLMFYNVLAGGPEHGWRYTVHGDDWGQDQNLLGAWQRAQGLDRIGFARYSPRPDRWGIRFSPVPCMPSAGVFAIHVVELVRPDWAPKRCFEWLKGRTPDEKLGYSIFIYRVSEAEVGALRDEAPVGVPPLERWGDAGHVW